MLKAILILWFIITASYGLVSMLILHPVASGWLMALGSLIGISVVWKDR